MSRVPGQMMQMPLLISGLITHAARHSGDAEIVSRPVEGDLHRYTWAEAELRSRKLAQALARLGCRAGDRVGTLAWNGHRHLEIYYGTSGSGLICHTVNPRLFPQQIAWIINDAADRVLCFDVNLLPLVEKIASECRTVQHFVLLGERGQMPSLKAIPNLLCYEELVEAEGGDLAWPVFDEQAAAGLCYTSGTTGDPKGALYSHRSTVLHSYAAALPDAMGLRSRDVVLPVVPMFHVNAWGLPYATALVGCKVVFPGPHLDGRSLYELMEAERVTFSAGVPTVWLGLLSHVRARGLKFSTFRRTVIGGSACPPSMIDALEDEFGVEVVHAWGMTELSPLGTLSRLRAKHLDLPKAEQRRLMAKQGRAPFGIELRIVDGEGASLPWDGQASGELQARGHWVIDRYFGIPRSPLRDGWFPTGDVASIDADGFMQVTDRSKDVIKSGGEWISSIALENLAAGHPAVEQAAVVAVAHPRWGERPLLAVVLRPGASATREELLAFYEGKVPGWQVPDDVVFLPELPQTATGKIQKLKLREAFRSHAWPEP
jgi:3-(methylthio)propionyl---CoA ligase